MMKRFLFTAAFTAALVWQIPTISATCHDNMIWNSESEAQEVNNTFFRSRAMLKMHAKELGIDIKGKDEQTLASEVYESMLVRAAKELNIELEGKSKDELTEEIHHERVIKKQWSLILKQMGKLRMQ